jgi:AcrR family transcriptional regulator
LNAQHAKTSDFLSAKLEHETAGRILLAAVDAFADLGYHAATTRDIARRAGLSSAGVYAFYASKSELLTTISTMGHEAALETLQSAMADVEASTDRIWRGVYALAEWHAHNHKLARIVQQELRALPADARPQVTKLRRKFQTLLSAELRRGVAAEEFAIEDVRAATTAILSLCIDITRWYSSRSPYSPTTLGERYADLCLRMISRPGQ